MKRLVSRLQRALVDGPDALPDDPRQLVECLGEIETRLEEKANEFEGTLKRAESGADCIERLQLLELDVAEKAVSVRATTIDAVLLKFQIWRLIGTGGDDRGAEDSTRSRLAFSIERDLLAISQTLSPGL